MIKLRSARLDDNDAIAAVVDASWGRPILDSLPRLFRSCLDSYPHREGDLEPGSSGSTAQARCRSADSRR